MLGDEDAFYTAEDGDAVISRAMAGQLLPILEKTLPLLRGIHAPATLETAVRASLWRLPTPGKVVTIDAMNAADSSSAANDIALRLPNTQAG